MQTVKEELLDPFTAQFRNVRGWYGATREFAVVCGEVNAKNRMGGYDGWKQWRFDTSDGSVAIEGVGPLGTRYVEICKNQGSIPLPLASQ